MALKLVLDFDNLRVSEVLRFADAIRSSGIVGTDLVEIISEDYDGQVSIPSGLSVTVSSDSLE